MILRSFGCSIIYGTDLSDEHYNDHDPWPQPSQLTWPALIAKELGLHYDCQALGGAGNLMILDRLLRQSALYLNDIFVINWTFIDRFDYSDHQGLHYNNGNSDWLTITPTNSNELAKIYYRELHSAYRDKITTLTAIYTAISVLSARKQKFFMTYEDPLFLEIRWKPSPSIVDLQERVRPYLSDINGQTFIQWSQSQGHPISDRLHPLESAHAAVAAIHRPKIESILRRA